MSEKAFWTGLFCAALVALTLGLGALGLGAATMSTLASGKVAYCYTRAEAPITMGVVYQLYGFREWRTDRLIGTYDSIAEAADAAHTYGCSMGVEK